MFECYDYSVRWFTLERLDIWKIAREQFNDATFRHHRQLSGFVEVLRTSGRLYDADTILRKLDKIEAAQRQRT